MPERGRYCVFLPLHASPRPLLAEYAHSSTRCVQQYVSFSSTYMRWYKVCSCVVQGWMYSSTCVGTLVQCRGFPFFTILHHPGERAIRPRDANVQRSPLTELGTAPVIRREQRRAAVWVGRGATARPREAEWSSRLAAVSWVCYNKTIFKDPN